MLLMILDPPSRANVFNQCGTAFRLPGDGPNVVPAGRPINNTQLPPVPSEVTRPTPMQGPGVHPTSHVPTPMPMQGPGVAPTSMPMQGPGVAPTPYVSVAPMQGPGVAPTTTPYVSAMQHGEIKVSTTNRFPNRLSKS